MSTYEPIASQTLGSAAASVTFSSIPQGYTDLVLVLNSASASADVFTYLQFNGDTATNYSHTQLYGNGTSAVSSRASNTSTMLNFDVNMETTSIIYNAIYQIQNYSNSTTFKTTLVRQNNTSSDYPGALAGVGLWRNTSPITTITIQATRGGNAYNFVSGSTFSLYGIQVGQAAQKAQGGNIVTTDGTYVYHTFTSSGSFIPSQALTVDYLVVAGGGGGGGTNNNGGGGGAGGLRSTVTATGGGGSLESGLSLTAKAYTVIVGAGGAGSLITRSTGANGSNSVFGSITSIGGGGGGMNVSGDAKSGGSGGGAAHPYPYVTDWPGGAGTANQGYAGGNGTAYGSPAYGGAGGGGAGAVGGNGNTSVAGAGGAGVAVSISGSSVTYAGGGGGGRNDGSGGAGGSSIGGNGGYRNVPASSPVINTGSGGGGGGNANTANDGGASSGASGVVIIRYAV